MLRRLLRLLGSMYVLIPAIVVAATALAYYSYRYAHELAQRGEQSIVDTTQDLADEKVYRIEQLIVDSDRNLFNLVDFENLREFPRRWRDSVRITRTIESAMILDHRFRLVPDGYVSKKRSKSQVEEFRQRFEREILPDLQLGALAINEHKHLHREYDGRYYLMSFTRVRESGQDFYVVLEADLVFLVGEVFPDLFAALDVRRVYQILDEHGNLVFGHPFAGIPSKYVVEKGFPYTIYAWKLRMAPREAPTLIAKESARRTFDVGLIVLSAATVFVGLALLTIAVRAERRANDLKSEFIANVSHELKTPLSLIRMFGELVATGRTKGPEQAREYAEIVMRESERLSRLIDNVLDFARIERGQAAYAFELGDLSEVLSRGLDVYRYRLDREGMKLTVTLDDDLPGVRFDESAMMLVLLNLVDNAVKYAADGKELGVGLKRKGDRVELAVSDKGSGIQIDEHERIFERFYRARSVRGRPVRGSGIGLSIVKHIAEAHGGGVTVESTVGKGSTFTVWIPIAEGSGSDEPPRDQEARA
jgi:two-component system phosphate regulon sensor histidine kinase PhoR